MNNFLCILYLSILPSFLVAQSIWLEAQVHDEEVILYELMSQQKISAVPYSESQLINYNPSIPFIEPINFPLNNKSLDQCNSFTVYQSQPYNKEGLIWTAKNGAEDQLMLTDKRMVDFASGKFMNFLDQNFSTAQLNTYHHFKQGFSVDRISFGNQPANLAIPVGSFLGTVSEALIFEKILAPQARQVLESSLGIKYGIALAEGIDYLDTHGRILWRASEEQDYNHRVSGLGRSTELRLNQKQSKTNFGEGSISIGLNGIRERNDLNPSEISEQSYFIWADNDEAIHFEEDQIKISILDRRWKMSNHGIHAGELTFRMEHRSLIDALEEGQKYWLVVYEQEKINLVENHVYEMKSVSDYLQADGITIPENAESYFTLLAAPKFWVVPTPDDPSCETEELGKLQLTTFGGKPPYSIKIKNEQEEIVESVNWDEKAAWTSSELSTGFYNYEVIDASGQKYQGTVQLNYNDLPAPKIETSYSLTEGESLWIDAAEGMPEGLEYTWILPTDVKLQNANIEISTAGEYSLEIKDRDCINQYKIRIKKGLDQILQHQISPNPTGDGYFALRATLAEANAYQIIIRNAAGQNITSQSFEQERFIFYQHRLKDAGVYFITLQTGQSISTKKLIVLESH